MRNILILLFLVNHFSFSQTSNELTKNILTLSIIDPGISYEQSIGPASTLKFRTAITSATYIESGSTFELKNLQFSFNPLVSIGYRNYYNMSKRNRYGYNTENNSANYLSISAIYVFKNLNEIPNNSNLPQIGLVPSILWGMQRSFSRKLFFDFNIGPGLNIQQKGLILSSEISLGFSMGSK
jgi:hypothetical protein